MKTNVSRFELEIINRIANRAVNAAAAVGIPYQKSTALMDLVVCHANGCPLRLDELEKAGEGEFAHDVFGIRKHLNRETGQLEDCFVPRYAYQGKGH